MENAGQNKYPFLLCGSLENIKITLYTQKQKPNSPNFPFQLLEALNGAGTVEGMWTQY